jgi:hypothetical protein
LERRDRMFVPVRHLPLTPSTENYEITGRILRITPAVAHGQRIVSVLIQCR